MYEDIYASIRYAAQKRNLRESTIDLYCNDVRYFLKCTGKEVADLTTEDVDAFLTTKRLEGRSPETYNHYHSAIRFFYKKILKLNWDDEDIPRMKLNRSLPTVLSREEISAIIDVTKNLKHKAMITTMYSSGLRVSEVIHLHYDDISRTNMTIHVRNTKSRRDRYTILSQKNLDLLTEYWFKCGRPREILFPSSWTGSYLDVSSVNQFFKASAKRQESHGRYHLIHAATASPVICMRTVPISVTFRHCLVISILDPLRSMFTSVTRGFLVYTALMTCIKAVKHER